MINEILLNIPNKKEFTEIEAQNYIFNIFNKEVKKHTTGLKQFPFVIIIFIALVIYKLVTKYDGKEHWILSVLTLLSLFSVIFFIFELFIKNEHKQVFRVLKAILNQKDNDLVSISVVRQDKHTDKNVYIGKVFKYKFIFKGEENSPYYPTFLELEDFGENQRIKDYIAKMDNKERNEYKNKKAKEAEEFSNIFLAFNKILPEKAVFED